MLHHPCHDAHIRFLDSIEPPVEYPVKPARAFVWPHLKPQGTLCRLQGKGIDGADNRGCGNDKGELAIYLPRYARKERGR